MGAALDEEVWCAARPLVERIVTTRKKKTCCYRHSRYTMQQLGPSINHLFSKMWGYKFHLLRYNVIAALFGNASGCCQLLRDEINASAAHGSRGTNYNEHENVMRVGHGSRILLPPYRGQIEKEGPCII